MLFMVVEKFKKLATHVVSAARADNVVNLVLGAEKLERAEHISRALAAEISCIRPIAASP